MATIMMCSMCSNTDSAASEGDWCPKCNEVSVNGYQIESPNNNDGVFTPQERESNW